MVIDPISSSGHTDTGFASGADLWMYTDWRSPGPHFVSCADDPSPVIANTSYAGYNTAGCVVDATEVCKRSSATNTIQCDSNIGGAGPPGSRDYLAVHVDTDVDPNYDMLLLGEVRDGQQYCCQYADPNDSLKTALFNGSHRGDIMDFSPPPELDDLATPFRPNPGGLPIVAQVTSRRGPDRITLPKVDVAVSWIVFAGMDNDWVVGSPQDDQIHAGLGNDSVLACGGDDVVLDGGGFQDILVGDDYFATYSYCEPNRTTPVSGNDFLCGRGSRTRYIGGGGTNTLYHDDDAAGPPARFPQSSAGTSPTSHCGDASWWPGWTSSDTDTASDTATQQDIGFSLDTDFPASDGWAGECIYDLMDSPVAPPPVCPISSLPLLP